MTELVGPYRVLRAIGAGGSARVDLAVLSRPYGFERQVVLKRPLEHLRGDATVARSLQREAALGGRLAHPNLIATLDAGVHDGYDYVVLELVDGLSLRDLMRDEGGPLRAIERAAVLSIVIDVARGLHAAHELSAPDGSPLGLVHRDVSPANILIGRDGTVKVADFGIAKDTRVDTLSGSMRGTVTYMAPEQCRGHAFDRRADVFALGVILHELLTQRRLFDADSEVASLHRVLAGDVPDPRAHVPSIPAALAELTMHALAHDPMARLGSAAELADALEDFAARTGLVTGRRAIAAAVAAREHTETVPRLRVVVAPATEAIVTPAEAPMVPRRASRWFLVPVALAAAALGAIGWVAARRTETAASNTADVTAPADVAPPSAPVATDGGPTAPAPAPAPVAVETAPAPAPPAPKPTPKVSRTRPHRRTPAATTRPAPATEHKVEWNRGLLLPTDGTKK